MTVRAAAAVAVLLFASVAEAAGVPPPGCVGTTWTRTWSRIDAQLDPSNGQTTAVYFTVQAPCYVTFDADFVITAKVVDERCAMGQLVGAYWGITDTDMTTNITSTIAGAGVNGVSGFAGMKLTVAGVDPMWVATVKQHYGPTGTPANHRIGFRFLPRADSYCNYVEAMSWDTQLIGTTTYDPYPDTTTVDPAPPASTDPGGPATVDPGGSGTVDPGSTTSTDGGGTSGGGGGGTGGTGGTTGTTPGATPPTTEAGGCGSSGVTPALLGIAALAAAGFPRRRRAR